MDNPQQNVFNFNLNPQHAAQVVDDVFGDLPDDMLQQNNNQDDNEDENVMELEEDKKKFVIGVNELQSGVVYYKVMDNDTKLYKKQIEYVGNPDGKGVIYHFKDNLGTPYIPLTSRDRFIPAYLMLDETNFPNRENENKTKFAAIPGIEPDETSGEEHDSDDSDYEGGKKRGPSKKQKKFHFTSTQKHQHGGKKTVRHVTIKNGKGHKKVSHYRGNKLIRTVKKSLKKPEMEMIRIGKFIPGLFRDCQVSQKKKHYASPEEKKLILLFISILFQHTYKNLVLNKVKFSLQSKHVICRLDK